MDYYAKKRWGPGKKILFRFAFLYVLLYTLPSPYDAIPGISVLSDFFNSFWNNLGVWVGSSILSIEEEINTQFMGSSDRLIDYIRVLIYAALSVTGTLLWTILDRHRLNYRKQVYWFRLHLRYYLFATLFTYGIVKVIDTQFSFPGLWRLLQPFGEASPMGLAWSFMGFSKSYTFFAGMMEIIAALLLLFRKTTTLGALVSLGVMTHVMVLNFSYDIPVKQFSMHLVLFSLVLLSFDGKRLLNLFVLNSSVSSVRYRKIFEDVWDRRGVLVLKILFVGYIMISSSLNAWQRYQQIGPDREKPVLYGIWEVESFERKGSDVPPLITDDERWWYLIIEHDRRANIIRMTEERQIYETETNPSENTFRLNSEDESYFFEYTEQDSTLSLTGEKDGESLVIELNKYDLDTFILLNRGFNWVQEFPFNR
ncbi:hypothetical protein BH23BAC3_BH23BAC3_33910 [soil metagenome]